MIVRFSKLQIKPSRSKLYTGFSAVKTLRIVNEDITHSIALFYKTTDSNNQFLYLKK
jgi:hypothetical protein